MKTLTTHIGQQFEVPNDFAVGQRIFDAITKKPFPDGYYKLSAPDRDIAFSVRGGIIFSITI